MAKGVKTGGRTKGTPNKKDTAIAVYAKGLLESPAYRTRLEQQLLGGTLAPSIEMLLYHYAYGKPVERFEGNITNTVIEHRYGRTAKRD